MNQREEAFVRNYTVGRKGVRGNATKSTEAAGYSPRTAGSQGHRLLKKAEIKRAIAAHRKRAADRATKTMTDWMELVPGAQDVVVKVSGGKVQKGAMTRLAGAREILDRALGKPRTSIHHTGNLTIEDLLSEAGGDSDSTELSVHRAVGAETTGGVVRAIRVIPTAPPHEGLYESGRDFRL